MGAGIGTHEVVAGHIIAGELRRLVDKLVLGGGGALGMLSVAYVPVCHVVCDGATFDLI